MAAAALVGVLCVPWAAARPYSAPAADVYFDVPEGWEPYGTQDRSSITFANASGNAFVQLFMFEPGVFASSQMVADHVTQGLKAEAETAAFSYGGAEAVFAQLNFGAANVPVTGYGVFFNGSSGSRALIGFAPETVFAGVHDQLLSAMDSYAGSASQRRTRGPISRFLYPAPEGAASESAVVRIAGTQHTVSYDPEDFTAALEVIEREARLLAASTGEDTDTWSRFYRVVFRDNVQRLARVSELFGRPAAAGTRATAEALLVWLQEWEYMRPGELSDLLPPLQAVIEMRGDCDTRGLVFNIMSSYSGLDAVMLVSSTYRHSVCGVAVEGPGARVEHDGTSYVIAETTADVDLGLIAADMADPAGWIIMDLYEDGPIE